MNYTKLNPIFIILRAASSAEATVANRRQSYKNNYSISVSQVLRQYQSLPDKDLRLPGLVRDLRNAHFSVTDPAPVGTSLFGMGQPDHA
jgi:hypothetical protein